MPRALPALVALVLLAGCGGASGTSGPGAPADGDGWVDLFDGTSLDGWHGYARPDVPASWSVEDGVLTLTPGSDDGGDLVAPGTYGDFELEVEWRIAACGNSGVFYRGEESAELAPIYRTALEMQLLDDCHPDGQYPSHRNGGLYDLYTPTASPAASGAWVTSRVVADGDRIEHWVDGERVVVAEQGSEAWDARVAVSKFRDPGTFPGYGTRRSGIVGIQDHGDRLEVRAVRVRSL